VKEIHHALAQKGRGKNITLTILQEGVKEEIAVMIPTLKD
jgi:hypothetical protein